MSNKLEQILELLLAENNEQAEEMLHEYVVSKARAEYERVLDESEYSDEEDDYEEDAIDDSDAAGDFADDIKREETAEADDEEMDFGDEELDGDMDSEMDMDGDMDSEMDMDSEEEFEGDDDLEDKVEDLEAELEDLRAEFEQLMSDEDGDDEMDGDMDADADMDSEMGMDDEMGGEDDDEVEFESYEYDLDEADEIEEDDEVVEEATQFSQTDSEQPMKSAHTLKGGEEDSANSKSPYSSAPKPTTVKNGNTGPVKAKDGSEGKKTPNGSVKSDPTHHNIKVASSKATKPSDAKYQ